MRCGRRITALFRRGAVPTAFSRCRKAISTKSAAPIEGVRRDARRRRLAHRRLVPSLASRRAGRPTPRIRTALARRRPRPEIRETRYTPRRRRSPTGSRSTPLVAPLSRLQLLRPGARPRSILARHDRRVGRAPPGANRGASPAAHGRSTPCAWGAASCVDACVVAGAQASGARLRAPADGVRRRSDRRARKRGVTAAKVELAGEFGMTCPRSSEEVLATRARTRALRPTSSPRPSTARTRRALVRRTQTSPTCLGEVSRRLALAAGGDPRASLTRRCLAIAPTWTSRSRSSRLAPDTCGVRHPRSTVARFERGFDLRPWGPIGRRLCAGRTTSSRPRSRASSGRSRSRRTASTSGPRITRSGLRRLRTTIGTLAEAAACLLTRTRSRFASRSRPQESATIAHPVTWTLRPPLSVSWGDRRGGFGTLLRAVGEIVRFDLNTSPVPPEIAAAVLAAARSSRGVRVPPSVPAPRRRPSAVRSRREEILVGAGADEILDSLARRSPGRTAASSDADLSCTASDRARAARTVAVPRPPRGVGPSTCPPFEALARALVWLCSPNNATALATARTTSASRGPRRDAATDGRARRRILDEAYAEFVASHSPGLSRLPAVVVVRPASRPTRWPSSCRLAIAVPERSPRSRPTGRRSVRRCRSRRTVGLLPPLRGARTWPVARERDRLATGCAGGWDVGPRSRIPLVGRLAGGRPRPSPMRSSAWPRSRTFRGPAPAE